MLVDRATAACLKGTYNLISLDSHKPSRTFRPRLEVADPSSWPGPAFALHWNRAEPWCSLTLPRRLRLLCLAASSCHPASLDAALAFSGVGLRPEVMEAAAAAGDLRAVQRLLAEGCEVGLEAVKLRRAFGWLGPHDVVAEAACAGGHAAVLGWLEAGLPPAAARQEQEQEAGSGEAAVELRAPAEEGQQGSEQQQLQQQPAAAAAADAAAGDGAQEQPGSGLAASPPPHTTVADAATAAAPSPPAADAASGVPDDQAAAGHEPEAAPVAGGGGDRPAHAAAETAAFAPRGKAFARLMTAAACHGHLELLEQLHLQYERMSELLDEGDTVAEMLNLAALGMEDDELAGLHGSMARWGRASLLVMQRVDLLACALCSLNGSWRVKADWLLSTWAAEVEAGELDPQSFQLYVELAPAFFSTRLGSSNRLVVEQPDVLDRFRFAGAHADLPVAHGGWHVHAARAALATGNMGLLEVVLADWGRAEEAVGSAQFQGVLQEAVVSDSPRALQLLLERFHPAPLFSSTHMLLAAEKGHLLVLECMYPWFPVTAGQLQQPGGGGRAAAKALRRMWSQVFQHATQHGASLPLLRHLHYACGVPVDVEAVAAGGSVEAVEWAVWAQLQQELAKINRAQRRGTLRPDFSLSVSTYTTTGRAWRVAAARGNLAAAARMLHYGARCHKSISALQQPVRFFTRPRAVRYFSGDDGRVRAFNCLRLWASLLDQPMPQATERVMYIREPATADAEGPAAGGGEDSHVGGGNGGGSHDGGSANDAGARERVVAVTVHVGTAVPYTLPRLPAARWAELVSHLDSGRCRSPQLLPHQLDWVRFRQPADAGV
ncbi:hypothetical protein HXX76_013436 [Chlamydomonas incerta]|uniref:Uncharacterized protein n=1 Tax=Chlamydomonas incerta TaxID=51695 RepID=A0A835STY9_CHLIN|nr:hypothetical protein HXX76_013436 [Chlamydomonas incerta]|eukprot:KAG2425811.1 hypothetical protein HXX76_013436 [Chlamydomonas incerta]